MINFVLSFTFLIMFLGYLAVIGYALKQRDYQKTILLVIVPFYVFHYILKLPETRFKKVTAIVCIGIFWIFFFVGILKIVFTPPV